MYGNQQLVQQGLAGAAITAFSFVKSGGTPGDKILLAGSNEETLGVGPDYAVASGAMAKYAGEGVAQLKLGGTVTAGNDLISDGSGFGVARATTGTTIQNVGAIALRDGVSGDIIPVRVIHLPIRPALS